MITISQAVRDELLRSPFLMEVLSEGIANVTQVARKIRPAIEKRLYEKVTDASIAVAVHRLTPEFKRPQAGKDFLKALSDITVRSKLVEFVFKNSEDLPALIETLLKKVHRSPDAYLTFSQGLHESVLIISARHEDDVLELSKKTHPHKLSNLSAITLRLPEDSLSVPGVYYPILKAIAFENISFVEIVSTNTELSILFTEEDIDRAFSTIQRITSSVD